MAVAHRAAVEMVEGLSLDQIADAIKDEMQAEQADKVWYAMRYGSLLSAARKKLNNDNKAFGVWCSENVSEQIDQRTAHNYRTLYENFGALADPVEAVKEIGLSRCYTLRPDQVSYFCAQAEAGKLNRGMVMGMLGKGKPEPQPDPEPEEEMKPEPKPKVVRKKAKRQDNAPAPDEADDDPSPERIRAAERILDEGCTLEEAGATIGVSAQVMKTTVAWLKGYRRRGQEAGGDEGLSENAKTKLAALQRKLEREFEVRVEAEVQVRIVEFRDRHMLPKLKADVDHAQRMLARRAKVITKAEMRALKMCAHPDGNPSEDMKALAFAALEKIEVWAVDEDEPKREKIVGGFADILRRAAEDRRV